MVMQLIVEYFALANKFAGKNKVHTKAGHQSLFIITIIKWQIPAQLRTHAKTLDICCEPGAKHPVFLFNQPCLPLPLNTTVIESAHDCCCCFAMTIDFGGEFHDRLRSGVPNNADSVAAQLNRSVSVEKRMCVENVIHIPYQGLTPVNELPAKFEFEISRIVVYICPVYP